MAGRRSNKQFVAQLRVESAGSTWLAEQFSPAFPGSPGDAGKRARSFQMLRLGRRTEEADSCANCALETKKVRKEAIVKAASASGTMGCVTRRGRARRGRLARRGCAGAGIGRSLDGLACCALGARGLRSPANENPLVGGTFSIDGSRPVAAQDCCAAVWPEVLPHGGGEPSFTRTTHILPW